MQEIRWRKKATRKKLSYKKSIWEDAWKGTAEPHMHKLATEMDLIIDYSDADAITTATEHIR